MTDASTEDAGEAEAKKMASEDRPDGLMAALAAVRAATSKPQDAPSPEEPPPAPDEAKSPVATVVETKPDMTAATPTAAAASTDTTPGEQEPHATEVAAPEAAAPSSARPVTDATPAAASETTAAVPSQETKPEPPLAHPSVYLVADHLDAMLAAGEDLEALIGAPAIADPAGLRARIERMRTFELFIIARALQAAERARDLKSADPAFKPLVDLFVAGTAVLSDRIAEYGDSSYADFQSGDDGAVYLAERGLGEPGRSRQANGRHEFYVAGLVALSPLMDMCASFLDALEARYALFPEDADAHPTAEAA